MDLSESGTLISNFNNHNLVRNELSGQYLWEIPKTNRWTLAIGGKIGWIDNASVDSFFYFFSGGMPGIKGYPFYSLAGTNTVIGDVGIRIPLFREKHFSLGWFTLQHSTIGLFGQIGDAWNRAESKLDYKRSFGIELRFQGYSFYNYPTSIGMELHRGLDMFTISMDEINTIQYGAENRIYLTILFGF